RQSQPTRVLLASLIKAKPTNACASRVLDQGKANQRVWFFRFIKAKARLTILFVIVWNRN
ncbi:MAG TPA: hypothetical protein V6D17_21575, partial [Candidatus Obscuribacterales bacterium]